MSPCLPELAEQGPPPAPPAADARALFRTERPVPEPGVPLGLQAGSRLAGLFWVHSTQLFLSGGFVPRWGASTLENLCAERHPT